MFSPQTLKRLNYRIATGGLSTSRFATRNDGEAKFQVASGLKSRLTYRISLGGPSGSRFATRNDGEAKFQVASG
ncbi:MAG: hypothetical protein Q4C70_14130, partial [Planctomycetia bacterium]|nr:hypothetical protein [Planctomycetia bacterium]